MALWIILGVAAVVVIWAIATYNSFRRMKVMIQESWSGIDVQLKRKANILPNLVDTLKMQMNFETTLLTQLTEARSGLTSGSPKEAMAANDKLSGVMSSINAVAEAYPTLGTNASFLQMMGDIRDCEDKVSYARNRYNMTVARYNMSIVMIPASIIAGSMGLKQEDMFEIPDQQRTDADNIRISQL